MAIATVNGVRLRYEREGRGERVLLVHGSWGDHESWRSVVPLLSRDHEVVTYDRRGHSASDAPAGQGSIVEDVDDVAGLIQHLGSEPAHLVGNSVGAAIALRVAAEFAHLLRSVSANEPDLFEMVAAEEAMAEEVAPVLRLIESGAHEEAARLFMETMTFGPGAWERLPEPVRRRYIVNAPTFLDQHRDPDRRWTGADRLAAAPVPVHLMYGDQTRSAFRAVVEALVGKVSGARVSVLRGCGHASAATHPVAFVAALRAFWAESRPETA